MVKHVVMWKLKNSLTFAEKKSTCQKIRDELLGLKELLPEIKEMEVGVNVNPAEDFDLVLVTVFETLGDIQIYSVAPAHQSVAAFIKSVSESRGCVDYEF